MTGQMSFTIHVLVNAFNRHGAPEREFRVRPARVVPDRFSSPMGEERKYVTAKTPE